MKDSTLMVLSTLIQKNLKPVKKFMTLRSNKYVGMSTEITTKEDFNITTPAMEIGQHHQHLEDLI